jgi:hypothetical protein
MDQTVAPTIICRSKCWLLSLLLQFQVLSLNLLSAVSSAGQTVAPFQELVQTVAPSIIRRSKCWLVEPVLGTADELAPADRRRALGT